MCFLSLPGRSPVITLLYGSYLCQERDNNEKLHTKNQSEYVFNLYGKSKKYGSVSRPYNSYTDVICTQVSHAIASPLQHTILKIVS